MREELQNMPREVLIQLVGEDREDGTTIVHSPNLPFLHLVIGNWDAFESTVLPLVKDMLERRFNHEVQVSLVESLSLDSDDEPVPHG